MANTKKWLCPCCGGPTVPRADNELHRGCAECYNYAFPDRREGSQHKANDGTLIYTFHSLDYWDNRGNSNKEAVCCPSKSGPHKYKWPEIPPEPDYPRLVYLMKALMLE